MSKTIKIGFSPCPNDTFIFDALLHGKIDTGGFNFEPIIADVEELNRMAVDKVLDFTKLSYGAYAHVSRNYRIMNAGSALGAGTGPILVAKRPINLENSLVSIGIPGNHTTANLLLTILFPELTNKDEFLYSEISEAVVDEIIDTGLLIHEGRFTYSKKGLLKLVDLGDIWEQKTNMPIPLGCIAASRSLDTEIVKSVDDLIKKSIEFAQNNPDTGREFIKYHAQELDDEVIDEHIALYVNNYSLALGKEGKKIVEFMLNKGIEVGLLPDLTYPIFIN
jgi:5,8-dihydroxy-2-naphthoate synthase